MAPTSKEIIRNKKIPSDIFFAEGISNFSGGRWSNIMSLESIKRILMKSLNMKCSSEELTEIAFQINDSYLQEYEKEQAHDYIERFHIRNVKTKQVENVPFTDILYFDTPKKETFIYTKTAQFEHKNKEYFIPDELLKHDCFTNVEKQLYVNINKMKKYNSFLAHVYFDEIVTDDSLRLQIYTIKRMDIIKKILGREHDLYNSHTTSEYSPINMKAARI